MLYLTDADAEDIPRIGHLLWHEAGDAVISYQAASQITQKHGLQALPAPSLSKAYHHALRTYRSSSRDIVVGRLPKKGSVIRHQVTIEAGATLAGEDVLHYDARAITELDLTAETLEVHAYGSTDADAGLQADLLQHLQEYTRNVQPEVIRLWANNIINKAHGVAARAKGGLWFVGARETEQIRRLEAAMAEMGATLYLHPVFDTQTWRSHAAGFVEDGLGKELRDLNAALSQVLQEAPEGVVPRFKLETRLGAFRELEKKARGYVELLGVTQQALIDGVNQSKALIGRIWHGSHDSYQTRDRAAEIRDRERAARRTEKQALKAEKADGAVESRKRQEGLLEGAIGRTQAEQEKPEARPQAVAPF